MGLTIKATNSKLSFDMGGGGFFNLRKNIALALDKDLGQNYEESGRCYTEEEIEANCRVAETIIRVKHLDAEYEDVLDFLYASDLEGSISHKTCKKIYELIKDVDFGKKCFRYAAYAHNDYEEFKEFLKECYSHSRKMRWN